jgi:hypothetical protein
MLQVLGVSADVFRATNLKVITIERHTSVLDNNPTQVKAKVTAIAMKNVCPFKF